MSRHEILPDVGPLLGPLRIRTLLVENSAFDRQHILRMRPHLAFPLAVEEAADIAMLHERLATRHYDLILLDYGLDRSDGLQVLQTIAACPGNRFAARIMITGNARTELAVAAMHRGCHDVLLKDHLTPDVLSRAIAGALARAAAATAPPPGPASARATTTQKAPRPAATPPRRRKAGPLVLQDPLTSGGGDGYAEFHQQDEFVFPFKPG
ncbi:response regulator [Aquicoccus sp. SCR17]|nr:response regulator [Carideicomes alvinocaridis]